MNNEVKRRRLFPLALTLFFAITSTTYVSAQTEKSVAENTIFSSHLMMHQANVHDDGVSNEELLKGYVQQLFDESLGKRSTKAHVLKARNSLNGNNLKLYDYLKNEIQKIAEGKQTSTVIQVPLSEVSTKLSWTKEELGGIDIIVGSSISNAAINAAIAKLGTDVGLVIHTLMADCPYELYWFDKTTSYSWGYGSISASSDVLELKGPLTVTMCVSANYSSTGSTGTTTMKSLVAAVTTAINNAKNIATNATGSVLERLTYYKTQICKLVSYNDAAVADNTTPYGDPWQLVWVFDGDASTKVVCEGYSKAFKYLCDLSNFEGVDCLIASGTMSGGTGAGGHMWNIVCMDDGRSYLVDVTNSDEGTVGQGGELFMGYGPSGSYASGYTFTTTSPNISFVYDVETKANFPESALTLSDNAYTGPIVALDMTGNIATQLASYTGKTINITHERTGLTASKPITVCLPYNYTINPSDGKYYTFTGVAKNGDGKWIATMNEYSGASLEANKSYLFVPSGTSVNFGGNYQIAATIAATSTNSSDGKWTFHGVYEKKTWAAKGNDYGFAAVSGTSTDGITPVNAGDFVRADVGASIEPLRSYLTYNGGTGARTRSEAIEELPARITVLLVGANGNTTAIGEIETNVPAAEDNIWFTLDGRQLNGTPTMRGIYINNGKKIIVK